MQTARRATATSHATLAVALTSQGCEPRSATLRLNHVTKMSSETDRHQPGRLMVTMQASGIGLTRRQACPWPPPASMSSRSARNRSMLRSTHFRANSGLSEACWNVSSNTFPGNPYAAARFLRVGKLRSKKRDGEDEESHMNNRAMARASRRSLFAIWLIRSSCCSHGSAAKAASSFSYSSRT